MSRSVVLVASVCMCAVLFAQNPAPQATPAEPPAAQTPAPAQLAAADQQPDPDPVYVRRISIGATLSVLATPLIPENSITTNTTNPVVQTALRTEATTKHVGYGGTVQLAISERFAVAASLYLRRIAYKQFIDIHTGVDNPNTLQDDRAYRASQEETRARLMDIPLVIRYYGKDRHDEGHRWFAQGGGVIRRVYKIGSSTQTTTGPDTVCCDLTPVAPTNRIVRGAVIGIGGQFIDPIGIRVVPEVRYTRWFAEPFNKFTTATKRYQIEIGLSLTF